MTPDPFAQLLDALQQVVNDAKIGALKATANATRVEGEPPRVDMQAVQRFMAERGMSETGRGHYYWVRVRGNPAPMIGMRSQISGAWYISGVAGGYADADIEVIRSVEPFEQPMADYCAATGIVDKPPKTPHDPLKGHTLLLVKTSSGYSYSVQPERAMETAMKLAQTEPVYILDGHTREILVSLGKGQTMINNPIPDDVLEAMADAMLDPPLRIPGKVPNAEGNKVRTRALSRALAAAEELGWVMVKAETRE